jgi:hypothetical protein
MIRVLPLALLLAGCSEFGLGGDRNGNDPNGGDTDGGVRGDTDTWPPRDGEYCNGLDDDGDGLVDEGFPDTDGDGRADCVDEDCELFESDAREVGADEDCAPNGGLPPVDPWEVDVAWGWRGEDDAPAMNLVITPPVVGRITDDNGDGIIDTSDPTDVAFVAFDTWMDEGRVVVLDGATGDLHFTIDDVFATGGLALADVTGSGTPELLTFNRSREPVAFDHTGRLVWRAIQEADATLPQVTVADLDADGIVDVIADTLRIRGTDGTVLARYGINNSISQRMPAIGDIDLDGQQEVVLGNVAFEPDGTRAWWRPTLIGTRGHWAAILEADDDPEGEVAMVAAGRLLILEHDGDVIVDVPSGNDHPGAPCVADFDGDGEAEIAWASNNRLVLHDLDGSQVWAREVQDGTGLLATCSGFDFDGDGSMEILYNDNERAYILDGRTGAILFADPRHASTTIWEYPTIADIDDDGAAEVLVASNELNGFNGWSGVTVLRHAYRGWMPADGHWHVHDYAITNIDARGGVPARPEPSWQRYNVYRARPGENQLSVDLQPNLVDICFAGCHAGAVARVAVQIYNAGRDNSATGIPVALYTRDGDRLELLQVRRLGRRVAGGWLSDTLVFEVDASRIAADGLLIRVDDDGSGDEVHPDECDETNNELVWDDSPCTP